VRVLVVVQSCEEEWRTSTRRVQHPSNGTKVRVSFGRVCLWLRLACGHTAQRMRPLNREGVYVEPLRVHCDECPT
jgi:hypothetical protein